VRSGAPRYEDNRKLSRIALICGAVSLTYVRVGFEVYLTSSGRALDRIHRRPTLEERSGEFVEIGDSKIK
jgi:hypothetical protein